MESTFQKISRKSGKKPSQCKCEHCKNQCRSSSCLPTPEDARRIIAAGHSSGLMLTDWCAGMMMGVINRPVTILAPAFDRRKGACTFFEDGCCTLHAKGLKPTEGRLSHHTTSATNFNPKKSLAWLVAQEWIGMSDAEIENMLNA